MPYLELDHHRVFYNDTGEGEPLILLHNGFYSSQTWDSVRDAFAQHYRVIDYDRFGYGGSSHFIKETYDSDIVVDSASELKMVMDALGIDKAHVIGHCLGGAAALLFAADNPQRVHALVASAVGYFGSPKLLLATDMTFIPFDTVEPALRRRLEAMHGEMYVRQLWTVLRAHKHYIMSVTYDIRKNVFRFKKPLLMVNGDRDFYFEPAHPLSVFKKMRKSAEFWIVPGCGHDIHMEQPRLFVDEVLRFFARHHRRTTG